MNPEVLANARVLVAEGECEGEVGVVVNAERVGVRTYATVRLDPGDRHIRRRASELSPAKSKEME